MTKIKNSFLAQLLLQLKFTPLKQRAKQLEAAEKLYAIIDKTQDYPFDFVGFHITGFRHTGTDAQVLITGAQLSEDLQKFIAALSGQLSQHAAQQNQRVYKIDELAKTMGVAAKTINRWRKRGLIARKFLFPDGKKCLAFLQSSVDKFLDLNPSLVDKAKSFKRLTKQNKKQIVKSAAALVAKTNLSRYRIIRKIADDMGISHETVRYTLVNYEKENPQKPLFEKPSGVIDPAQAAEIYKLIQQGFPVAKLTRKYHRTKSSIYRIINERRARTLIAKKIEFIASDEFFQPNAAENILAEALNTKKIVTGKVDMPKLADTSLARYLHTVKSAPVFNRDRELNLFRRYNFLKYLASQSRASLKLGRISSSQIRKIERYLNEAETIKNMITEANLRLVVSIARKHTAAIAANLLDLVSEGNLSLVRAVEKFDYTRGFRFATYAAWAIAKDYAHHLPGQHSRLDTSEAMENIQKDFRIADSADFAAIERAHKSLIAVIRDNLNQREQYIIINHFGLMGTLVKKEKKTLTHIGLELGLSKERVRQIELIALQKLRHSLSPEQFDLLTG